MNSRLITDKELYQLPQYYELNGDSHDPTFRLQLAVKLAAPDYSCLRPPGAAGALLVHAFLQVWAIGCAEPPAGPTCKELGACEMEDGHCVRTVHAEVNAILAMAVYAPIHNGCELYSILKPCYQCTKVIAAAGIKQVYYAGAAYDEPRTNALAAAAGITMTHIDIGLSYGSYTK